MSRPEKKMAAFLLLNLIVAGMYILVVRPGNMQDASYWVYRIGALADEMRIHGGGYSRAAAAYPVGYVQ